jgi:DNA polymerase III sliding clamp (beta) subunit (PCNA family)
LINHDEYPIWTAFDPEGLIAAPDLGGRIGMVEWAAAKIDPPFCGVHFDGKRVVATDRYKVATVPMGIPELKEPVTVPAGILGAVLKQTGEVMIGMDKNQLLIMPDEYTQIRCVIYGQKYPNIVRVMDMNREHPYTVNFNKNDLLTLIDRALNFQGSNRAPTLRIFFGLEEIAVMMSDAEIGLIGDVLEVPGQCQHERFEVQFTPRNLQDIIQNAPNDKVDLSYNPEKPGAMLYLNGGSGYEAWAMPRMEQGEKSS